MNDLKENAIPLTVFLLTGITALAAYDHIPYSIPYVVFKYPLAIAIIYIFFRFVAYSDRRRSAQLDEMGLFRPLKDGAFLVCGHAHLHDLGIDLHILSSASSLHLGALSWILVTIGLYAQRQPQGLLGRLIDTIPIANRTVLCRGLIVSGILGAVGTFIAILQPLWLVLPLLFTLFFARKRSGATL